MPSFKFRGTLQIFMSNKLNYVLFGAHVYFGSAPVTQKLAYWRIEFVFQQVCIHLPYPPVIRHKSDKIQRLHNKKNNHPDVWDPSEDNNLKLICVWPILSQQLEFNDRTITISNSSRLPHLVRSPSNQMVGILSASVKMATMARWGAVTMTAIRVCMTRKSSNMLKVMMRFCSAYKFYSDESP